MPHDRRNTFRRQLRTRKFHITEPVVGKFGRKRFRAAHGKGIRRLGFAQVFGVKISADEYLRKLQRERAAKVFRCFYFDDACYVLPEIVHQFPFRGMDDILNGQPFDTAHRFAHLRHNLFTFVRNNNGGQRLTGHGIVLRFAVIYARKADKTFPRLPCFVRTDT